MRLYERDVLKLDEEAFPLTREEFEVMPDRREVVLVAPWLEFAPSVLELGSDQRGGLNECRFGDPLAFEAVENIVPRFLRRRGREEDDNTRRKSK